MLESRARTRSGGVAEAMRSKIVLSLALATVKPRPVGRWVAVSIRFDCGKSALSGNVSVASTAGIVDGVAAKKAFDSRPKCCDWPNANRLMARRIGRLARLPPKWAPTTSGERASWLKLGSNRIDC